MDDDAKLIEFNAAKSNDEKVVSLKPKILKMTERLGLDNKTLLGYNALAKILSNSGGFIFIS